VVSVTLDKLCGAAIATQADALARLRIAVFREYPYLYEGDLAYEADYIRRYSQAPGSVMLIAREGEQVVGASTAMPMAQEDPAFRGPLEAAGMDCRQIFYFGESVLLPQYRGHGVGRRFMLERLSHVQQQGGFAWACFCAVDRAADDPRRPAAYRPLDGFWTRHGFVRQPHLQAVLDWREIGEQDQRPHTLTFWLKALT